MSVEDERIRYAIEHTEVLRSPRQTLATFGVTNIYYYLVTEPAYADLLEEKPTEVVIREGRVSAERPMVVTPSYLINLEGFSEEAKRYFRLIMQEQGPYTPGLLYRYRNEPKGLTIVSEDLNSVVSKLNEKLDEEKNPLSTIIKGVDELWDVSLIKFIHELTERSLESNILELKLRGLLEVDRSGVPQDARQRIERLFELVKMGEVEPYELKRELDRWGLFHEYEDRFLRLFRR
ncbi:MAG: hypothetical protein DRI26_01650 [Chloroflexi bacterium]|nr:MAG: hypothetical protein DRI26_01650 [Chloroflexota bacterium]